MRKDFWKNIPVELLTNEEWENEKTMILKIFKYLFVGVFLMLILLLLIVITGSKMSMDSDFSHTNATILSISIPKLFKSSNN